MAKIQTAQHQIIWSDRKRHLGLPISFTKYTLRDDKLLIESGFLNLKREEVKLYRILDFEVLRPLGQRLFGVGSISIHSSDRSMKDFQILKIRNPVDVQELISEWVEKDRAARHITGREHLFDDNDFPEDDSSHTDLMD